MSGGRWVDVPGKGLRFLTSSGEYKTENPSSPWNAARSMFHGFLDMVAPGARQNSYQTQSARQNSSFAGSPAPGAPGAGGAQYVSPFQGRRDANLGLLRSRGYGIPSAASNGTPQPIVTGRNPDGTVNWRASDQYQAAMGQQAPAAPQYPVFPLTPQGQFERYFSSGSPEMDRYFGAASRGAGAPGSLEEMNALAAMSKAPLTSPLATYYRAQSAAGRGNMDVIATALTQGLTGKEAENMAAWARANPMLADRLYNKKFPGGFNAQAPVTTGAIPTPGSAAAEPTFVGASQGFDFNLNPPAAAPGTQGQNPTDTVKYLQQAYTLPEPSAPEKVDALLSKWGMAPGQRGTIIGN